MAPTIQVPVARTFNILENILQKRTDANRILKQKEKQMPSGEDYDRMEVDLDNEPFLPSSMLVALVSLALRNLVTQRRSSDCDGLYFAFSHSAEAFGMY